MALPFAAFSRLLLDPRNFLVGQFLAAVGRRHAHVGILACDALDENARLGLARDNRFAVAGVAEETGLRSSRKSASLVLVGP